MTNSTTSSQTVVDSQISIIKSFEPAKTGVFNYDGHLNFGYGINLTDALKSTKGINFVNQYIAPYLSSDVSWKKLAAEGVASDVSASTLNASAKTLNSTDWSSTVKDVSNAYIDTFVLPTIYMKI